MRRIEGAFSLVIMTENELIGVRDPHGFRPLSIGKVDDARISSETCAFDLIHAKFVRDVGFPVKSSSSIRMACTASGRIPEQKRRAFCMFETVYFARPDSTIAGRNVYKVRVEMGRQLAREYPGKPIS